MSLLLLPVEIFRQIMDLAVVTFEAYCIQEALELRLVNRYFDHEILRVFARTNLFDDYRIRPNWGKKHCDFLARFLFERPYSENTSPNGNFAALVNYIVDEILKHDNDGGSEQLRYQYLRKLCARAMATQYIDFCVLPKPMRSVSRVDNRYHVIIAAIYVDKSSIIDSLLGNGQMDVTKVESEIFGTPLLAAVQMRRYDLVRMLLQRGVDINNPPPHSSWLNARGRNSLLEATIFTQDEKMVHLLLEPHYGYHTYGKSFEQAILRSLMLNQPDIAHLLLEKNKSKLSECQDILKDGLLAACRYGMIEVVRLLLDHGGNVNEHAQPSRWVSTIELAAWTGQEEILLLLLARGANPYGRELGSGSMCAAAWGGSVGAVRILLEAGVRLKPSQWCSVLERAAPRIGSAGMIRLLLDRGVIELNKLGDKQQNADYYLVHFMGIACQQGNLVFVEALAQHGVSIHDESLYAQYNSPPPIVVAMAFRQNHLVQALQKFGVKQIDPLDSIVGQDFANGKYPCDAPPPPECTMPCKS